MSELSKSSGERRPYFSETRAMIELLRADATTPFTCAHQDSSPAVAIYEVPRGCVALPGLQTQALCPQHVMTDGSFEGMFMVVDLSIGSLWSEHMGERPDFYITADKSGHLILAEGAPPTEM